MKYTLTGLIEVEEIRQLLLTLQPVVITYVTMAV